MYEATDGTRFNTLEEARAYSLANSIGYHEVPTSQGQGSGGPGPVLNPNTNQYENRNASGQLVGEPNNNGAYMWDQAQGKYVLKKTAGNGFGTINPETGNEAGTIIKNLYEESQKTSDPNKLREEALKGYQGAIAAINSIYADLTAQEIKTGEGRKSQVRAIQSKSGLLGSPRGGAQTTKVEEQTGEAVAALQHKKGLEIQSIYTKVDDIVRKQVEDELAAKRAGATAYVDYLDKQATKKESRDQANTNAVLTALIQQGLEPDDVPTEDLDKWAASLQMPSNDLLTILKGKYKEKQDANAAALAKGELDKYQALPSDIKEYMETHGGAKPSQDELMTYLLKKRNATTRPPSGGGLTESERKRDIIAKINTWASSVAGADGFISPTDYNQARKDWALQGYDPVDFDAIFFNLANKAHLKDYNIDSTIEVGML